MKTTQVPRRSAAGVSSRLAPSAGLLVLALASLARPLLAQSPDPGAPAHSAPSAPNAASTSLAPARSLTEAERFAAQLALDYLARGPVAAWEALSSGSPLRDLSKDDALAEMEVRLGSPTGARWELRTPPAAFGEGKAILAIEPPSGLDQAVVLSIVSEGGRPRLHSIRSLAEPLRREAVGASPAGAPTQGSSGAEGQSRRFVLTGSLFLVGVLVFVIAVALRRASLVASLVAGAIGLLVVGGAGGLLLKVRSSIEKEAPAAGKLARSLRLGGLLALRGKLENGEPAALPAGGDTSLVARTWQAQLALQRGDRAEARKLLATLPDASELPWADLLRGRLGFLEKNEAESVRAYENVIDYGVFHDGLLCEAIEAFSILGYATARDWGLEKLTSMGSRSAEAGYLLAAQDYRAERWDDSEWAFRAAWRLRPLDRRSIFQVGSQMWGVLRRPAVFTLLKLGVPGDVVADPEPGLSSRPLSLPARSQASICGTHLRVRLEEANAVLSLPGGTELAPAGLVPEDAGVEERREEDRSLADLDRLASKLTSIGALAQPALRAQLERVSVALVRRHRYKELASLTAGFTGGAEQVPALTLLVRAEALRRTHRVDMGKALLAELEAGPLPARLKDAVLYYEMGELYGAMEDLDGAIRCVEKAFAIRREPILQERLRRLKAEKRLLSAFNSYSVGRFDVRVPETYKGDLPIRVGKVLNAEWTRMQPYIPSVKGLSVVVELLDFEDFQDTFGLGILGLFDGKIRLPILGVEELSPPIVTLITHELTHAMLADATDDRAPGWLQEGLAQRMEMQPGTRENKVPDLERMGTLLSISCVDEVLRAFPDPELVGAAYHESEWFVRCVERKHGLKALARLFTEFESGRTVDEAARAALGLSENELDLRFRKWAVEEAPREVRDMSIVRYEK